MRIDFEALADFAIANFDYSPEYEDDQWAITFDEQRIFCTRKRNSFKMEIGKTVFELPRV